MSTRATRDRSRATGSEVKDGVAGLGVPHNLTILAEAAATETDSSVRTRSGRVSKPPVRYEPVEQVEDDYAPDDYDSDESEVLTDDDDLAHEDDEEDDESDADEDGNLDGFVVPDKSESSDSENGEPSVPDTKHRRSVVIKKPRA